MNTPNAIQLLADKRIAEAKALFQAGYYDMAFYVAGYGVELYLKAKISALLNIPNFFDFRNRKKFENEDNIVKSYKVHNFQQLSILSGLLPEHNKMMLQDIAFRNDWSILDNWKENHRYADGKTASECRDLIDSVKNYTKWIRQFS